MFILNLLRKIKVERMKSSTLFRETSVMAWDLLWDYLQAVA